MVDFKALAAPFPPEEVSWRLGSTSKEKMRGMALAYLDARNVMDRLDEVCGPAGWQCKYSHANGKTVCDIGIFVRGRFEFDDPGHIREEWIWKADGAGDTDIEQEKGALSDAFKRAAVRWGIGRYLYMLESPWVEIEEAGRSFRIKKGAYRELDMLLRRFNQSLLNPVPLGGGLAQAKDDIASMQNAGTQPIAELKSAGRLAAEKYVSDVLDMLKAPGFDLMAYNDWKAEPCTPKGTKTHQEKIMEVRDKHPDLGQKIDDAVSDLSVARAA